MDPDELESMIWEAVTQPDRESDAGLLRSIDELVRARESRPGAAGEDLIWALSLKMQQLRKVHAFETARTLAEIGERRLDLRRAALGDCPEELARSLRELAALYSFEGEPFDANRARALEAEAAAFETALGDAHVR